MRNAADERPVLDPDRLLDALGGDVEEVRGVLAVFAEQRGALLARVRDAVGRADADGLEREAHSFKGTLATLGADAAAHAALRLEQLGRGRDLGTVAAAFAAFERELERLAPELQRLGA